MADFSLEPLLRVLADEFKRREMRAHLELLRAFYRSYRARKRAQMRASQPPWDEEMVFVWLAIFRVPPFECVYPVLGRGVPCPGCRADMAGRDKATVRSVFPGGTLRMCWACDARWLELDRDADL